MDVSVTQAWGRGVAGAPWRTEEPIPMPISKKPSRKAAAPSKPSIASVAPDRQAIEGFLAAVARSNHEDALLEAQEVMYDAWGETTSRSRITLARKALAISPLCADAYSLLAKEARTTQEARDLYVRGVEAGQLALGPAGFEEFDGHFWGALETRPYMRARHGLAMILLQLGDEDAALEHFRALLKLNPNDNQGIRYLLLAGLLRRDDMPGAKALLASYADEWSASWLYTRALIAFREGAAAKPATLKLLKDARSSNQHVPAILAGIEPPVVDDSGYVTVGGPGEATDYVNEFGKAWKDTAGAIAWLIEMAGPPAPKRPRAKTRPRNP
jgi:tetratricopeptide (TPR) repeat protein